jgi:hypothetical protein
MVQIPQQEPEAVTDSGVMIPPTPPIVPIAEAPPVLPASTDSSAVEEPEPLIRKRPRQTSEKSTQIIVSVILLSIVLLLAAAYIAVLYREKPSPPPPVPAPPSVLPQVVDEPPDEEDLTEEEATEQDPVIVTPVPKEEKEGEDEVEEPDPELVTQDLPVPDPETLFDPQPIRSRAVIDVAERLQLPIAALKADRTTLYDTATTLANYAGVPLTWDVPGMRLFGISLDKPLRIDFLESTVGEMLSLLLSQNGLAMLIEHEQIFIYPAIAADPALREARYDLTDFLRASSPDENARFSTAQMIEMIPRLIAPFSWQPHGGTGALNADGTVLVVNQTEINHKEIARFLEMIRDARKMPLLSTAGKTPQEVERILRELFPERVCEETLDKPLTLHYMTPTPLADIFPVLESALKLRFLVNHRTLNEAQSPFAELKGMVHVEKGTVGDAIARLLHSVEQTELTYRIVDWNTIEIITRDAALLPEYGTLESHFYGAKLRRQTEVTPEEMIAMLKNTVEPESWAETTFGGGAVVVDQLSETFFMRQSQPVHRIVHVWLSNSE